MPFLLFPAPRQMLFQDSLLEVTFLLSFISWTDFSKDAVAECTSGMLGNWLSAKF
jgi:hypothetical protein